MQFITKNFRIIVALLVGCIIPVILVILTILGIQHNTLQLAESAVVAMYDFETPEDLVAGQYLLQQLLTPEEFSRLCVDNDLRVVSAYYKFGYAPSAVEIIESKAGYIRYRLVNENIDPEVEWLFLYEIDSDSGRLTNIREHKMVLNYKSGE